MESLPARARAFRGAAAARGFAIEIVVTPSPARSAPEAAAACGCAVGQIVKSLVFRGEASGAAILFLVSGANRLDEGVAAGAVGERIARPDAAFVRAATGYAIGGIPPFGYVQDLPTFMDPTLLEHPIVWAAAGTPDTVFAVDPSRLRDVTAAVVVALC